MNPANDFELPVFDRPIVDLPSGMTYKQVVAEFDEISIALRLREVRASRRMFQSSRCDLVKNGRQSKPPDKI